MPINTPQTTEYILVSLVRGPQQKELWCLTVDSHDKVSVTHETEVKLLHFNYTKCTQKQKIALAFPVNPKHPDRLLLNDKYNPKYSKISTFHLVKVNSKFSPYNRVNQKIRNIFCLYSLNLKIHDWSLLISANFYTFTHISISY